MKKFISILLIMGLLSTMCGALAISSGEKRAVIGADISDADVTDVYKAFGVERKSVTELKVTNADERKYLQGSVDEALLGTHSISCVYIETLEAGKGLDVTTSNINWCKPEMYVGALATAGVTDAKVIVAAPFEVSGTAALTGVYMAYEDITGEKLDETAKLISTQELSVTAELADEIGSYDSVEIVNELKLILDETKILTDAELKAKILEIGKEYNVTLKDAQLDKLVGLCRQLEKLNSDALKEKVESVKQTIENMAEAKTKVTGFFASVKEVVSSIGEFFQRIFAGFKK
ncbi:MAG: DUF1002 domain-containing protein [Oscillospiraceae bacterium]